MHIEYDHCDETDDGLYIAWYIVIYFFTDTDIDETNPLIDPGLLFEVIL